MLTFIAIRKSMLPATLVVARGCVSSTLETVVPKEICFAVYNTHRFKLNSNKTKNIIPFRYFKKKHF
jgi:hypothetical protein